MNRSKIGNGLAVASVTSLLNFGFFNPAYASDLSDRLELITGTADHICGIVATSGEYKSLRVQGDVDAEVSGLLKKLATLGVSGTADFKKEDYQNVLRTDLPLALSDVRECKLKIYYSLQKKIIPDLVDTVESHASNEAQFMPLASPGHAGWIVESHAKCHVWTWRPEAIDEAIWYGDCRSGYASGKGILEYRVGTKTQQFVGLYANGRANGFGAMTFFSGNRYEGMWRDGRMDGHGIFTYADGGQIEGESLDGQWNGPIIQTWSSGQRFEGEARDGEWLGHGVLTWKDGNRFDGQWAHSLPNGYGEWTWPSGPGHVGKWINGCLGTGNDAVSLMVDIASCR